MKTLELKHLSAYLPYGLKMTRNGFIGQLITLKDDKESIAETFEFQVSCSNWWENTDDCNHYKPLLRPLSQLSKEIDHNGDRFVPMDLLAEDSCFYFDKEYVLRQPYWVVEKLLSWHFDIYQLLENNLAIEKQ